MAENSGKGKVTAKPSPPRNAPLRESTGDPFVNKSNPVFGATPAPTQTTGGTTKVPDLTPGTGDGTGITSEKKVKVEGDKISPPVGSPGAAWNWDPDKKQWVQPAMPTDGKNYIWDNANGWTVGQTGNVNPGSTGTTLGAPATERTYAQNTFRNTFALMFGDTEASQAYVGKLYQLVSGFYKSGSSIDESYNLALSQAYNDNAIPEFTNRFKGLFALKDKALKGTAVQVPTIAEFIAAENGMGDVLRSAGMGDLATQDYLGQIIGQGKSVHDVTVAINTSFSAIDGAPQAIKDTLASQFPMLDRTTLAKSLLMGPDGAAEVQKKIDMATTVTAGKQQGVNLTDAQKGMLSTSGLSYNQQLQGLGNVNLEGNRGQKLTDIYGKTVDGFGQEQAIQDQFQGLASAQRAKQQLINRERGSFSGSSGVLGASYGRPQSSDNKSPLGQI